MEAAMTKVAAYLRISTKDGSQDTNNQRLQLQQFCDAQHWEIVREYQDHESGSRADRPEFRQMMQDAGTRKWDLLVFWALDRFTREGTLATLRYLEQLESYGVRWRSFTEPWLDSAGPFRDVVISLLASLAKQERIRIRERVTAGLERARLTGTKSGKAIGRPRKIFDRQQVVLLRGQGRSWPEIARTMRVGVGTVVRAYRGLTAAPAPFQNPPPEAL